MSIRQPDPVHAQGEWVELNIEGRKYTVWAIRPVEPVRTISDNLVRAYLGNMAPTCDRAYYWDYDAFTAWLSSMPKPIR